MQAPPAELIETAADQLPDVPTFIRRDQLSELISFGDQRAIALGATGVSPDFSKGYELGLQTARVMLARDPKAAAAGIEI